MYFRTSLMVGALAIGAIAAPDHRRGPKFPYRRSNFTESTVTETTTITTITISETLSAAAISSTQTTTSTAGNGLGGIIGCLGGFSPCTTSPPSDPDTSIPGQDLAPPSSTQSTSSTSSSPWNRQTTTSLDGAFPSPTPPSQSSTTSTLLPPDQSRTTSSLSPPSQLSTTSALRSPPSHPSTTSSLPPPNQPSKTSTLPPPPSQPSTTSTVPPPNQSNTTSSLTPTSQSSKTPSLPPPSQSSTTPPLPPPSQPTTTSSDTAVPISSPPPVVLGSQTVNSDVSSYRISGSQSATTIAGTAVPATTSGIAATSTTPQGVIILDGTTLTADSASGFKIGSQTLFPGSAITVSGEVITLVTGNPTTTAPTPAATTPAATPATTPATTPAPLMVFGSATISKNSQSQLVIGSHTLSAGGVITVDGQVISLSPTGNAVIVNGASPSTLITTTSIVPPSYFMSLIIAGQTLTAGGVVTIGGDVLSLAPSATGIVVIGTVTVSGNAPTSSPKKKNAGGKTTSSKVLLVLQFSIFIITFLLH